MEFRLVILNEKQEQIFDKEIDTNHPDYQVSGGVVAFRPKKPFLCGGLIIEPNPDIPKPSFQQLSKLIKEEILEKYSG